jgi:long-chain acyl-CoA synthetase
MGLAEGLREGAQRHPDTKAIVVVDQVWSYADLDAATDRMVAGLLSLGLRPGDRVALHFPNGFEIATAFFACFRAGLIAVPLNTRMKGPELAYVLNHSGARVYLGHAVLFAEIASFRDSLTTVEQFFVLGDVAGLNGARPFADLSASAAPADACDVKDDDVAVILYTSGTTARPKGVTHTHRTLAHLARVSIDIAAANSDDVSGVVLPTCHIFGLSVLIATIIAGNSVVLIPKFEPAFVLAQLQQHGVTIFGALPVMLNALIHWPDAARFDLRRLRACFAGGDAVPTELHRRFKELFGCDVTEACGMTEVQPYSSNPMYGGGKVGSIGTPAPGVKLRLVDAFGRDVGPGEEGEILVQSPGAMVGYWNDPEATAATIKDGWLSTGDLARVDDDGYYWFVGRKKEIIIRGGSNISPVEVEEALYRFPAIREVGVVGTPDPTLGEIVTAFVAVKPGTSASEDDLRQFLAPRMAAYKIPERIYFVPDLPKGLTGKIQRKALKELAAKSV